jgi:hypothetical protein
LRNDAVVFDVEVAEESTEANRRDQEDDEGGANDGIAGQTTASFAAVASGFRDLDLDGHVLLERLAANAD